MVNQFPAAAFTILPILMVILQLILYIVGIIALIYAIRYFSANTRYTKAKESRTADAYAPSREKEYVPRETPEVEKQP